VFVVIVGLVKLLLLFLLLLSPRASSFRDTHTWRYFGDVSHLPPAEDDVLETQRCVVIGGMCVSDNYNTAP